jgi:tryptophan-rich sensory protein
LLAQNHIPTAIERFRDREVIYCAALSTSPLHPPLNAWAWALAACMAGALLEGLLSGTQIRRRFAELRLPKFAPPLWAWSIVGGAYYILFFFLLRSLLDQRPEPFWTPAALILTLGLLFSNASWNWIFFRKKNLWLSFVFFVPYGLLALLLAAVLFRLRSPLVGWYIFYLVYLVYAAHWCHSLWRLNRVAPSRSEAQGRKY